MPLVSSEATWNAIHGSITIVDVEATILFSVAESFIATARNARTIMVDDTPYEVCVSDVGLSKLGRSPLGFAANGIRQRSTPGGSSSAKQFYYSVSSHGSSIFHDHGRLLIKPLRGYTSFIGDTRISRMKMRSIESEGLSKFC